MSGHLAKPVLSHLRAKAQMVRTTPLQGQTPFKQREFQVVRALDPQCVFCQGTGLL